MSYALINSSALKEVPDSSIILNILPLDERAAINQYFADEVTSSFSDGEVMISA